MFNKSFTQTKRDAQKVISDNFTDISIYVLANFSTQFYVEALKAIKDLACRDN